MDPEKRRLARKRTDQLLYAEFGPDNGSILLNLSEEGCSFQSIAPVRTEQVRFWVSVGDGHKLEGDGQMVWSDTGKKTGGVRFLNPSQELREQVRAWLEQTLVTSDGKLDPAAVESEAKRRRKKLREEAKAAAERARKEGTLKGNKMETSGEDGGSAPQARPPSNLSTNQNPNPITAGGSTSPLGLGNSAVTARKIGMIALGAMLVMTLVTYRRELGHLVMSLGSSIAGDKGGMAAPTEIRPMPVNTSSEVKAAAIPDAPAIPHTPDTPSESTADTVDTAAPGDVPNGQFIRSAGVAPSPTKHIPTQQEHRIEDVSALWASVENGDTGAEVTLANRYVRGEGVPQSCAQARVLLEAAVKRGSLEAKQKLGELGQAGCP